MTEKRLRPYKQALKRGTMDQAVAEKISLEIFCATVLIGWRTGSGTDDSPYQPNVLIDNDGKEITFSKEAAVKLFTQLPDLFDAVYEDACSLSTFQVNEEEKTAKN